MQHLFDSLITAIIKHKDTIEEENESKKRDSVYLSPGASTPIWAAQAEEEEAREKARVKAASSYRCCSV